MRYNNESCNYHEARQLTTEMQSRHDLPISSRFPSALPRPILSSIEDRWSYQHLKESGRIPPLNPLFIFKLSVVATLHSVLNFLLPKISTMCSTSVHETMENDLSVQPTKNAEFEELFFSILMKLNESVSIFHLGVPWSVLEQSPAWQEKETGEQEMKKLDYSFSGEEGKGES